MELIEVRVSCPTGAVADAIGRAAMEARLCACAHVTPIRSMYRWKGEICDESEWSLALRTRADLVDRLSGLIREAHPYDLPAIMSHPCAADAETSDWIVAATS